MPFLPSEGEETKLLINEQMKNVLVFHYLPILWYRYPIPNDLREYWYRERPDILQYMEKAYQDLDIQFLPDQVVSQLNQEKLTSMVSQSFLTLDNNLTSTLPTELLTNNEGIFTNLISTKLNSIADYLTVVLHN
jgi:hypothetical protein